MGTNYIAPIWRMPRNANKDKLSNYSIDLPIGSDNVSMGIVPNLFIGSWSVSFWFKTIAPGAGNQNGCMVGRYVGGNLNGDLEMRSDNGHVVVATGQQFPSTNTTEANAIKSITSGLNDGNWHHVAFSLDYNDNTSTSTRSLYIDGSLDSSDNTTTPPKWVSNTTQTLFLGQLFNNNAVYNGSINQVSIFDYAFDSNQVTYLYNLNNPMAISGAEPIAYYPLGDNSNPIASAGYPNISVGADSVFDFDGAIGGALINLGNNSSLNITGSLSVSAWFKTLNNSDTIMIATKDNGSASRAWQLYMHNTGAIRFGINGVTALATSSGVYDDGNWHHVLGVYEPSNYVKLYIDGVADGEDASSVPASINDLPSQDVVVGGYDVYDAAGGRRWDGELSNIQIWNSVLGTSDATTLYNNGQPLMTGTQPQAANLQAWYKLNQTDSYWDLGGNGKWTFNNAAIN